MISGLMPCPVDAHRCHAYIITTMVSCFALLMLIAVMHKNRHQYNGFMLCPVDAHRCHA